MARDEKPERRGRGRLSSIDMLPDEAEPDIVWANEELRAGKRLAKDILAEFNARLADRGIGSISSSAFGRYSVRKAAQFRQLDQVHRISRELAETLGTDSADKLTVALTEMVKMAAVKALEGGIDDPKSIMELARAAQAAAGAQKTSAELRIRLESEVKTKAAAVVDKVGKERGLSKETILDIKSGILGIKTG